LITSKLGTHRYIQQSIINHQHIVFLALSVSSNMTFLSFDVTHLHCNIAIIDNFILDLYTIALE